MAHEQQTKSLEEEFEKIRLSLQVTLFLGKNKTKQTVYIIDRNVHYVLSDTN